MTSSLIDIPFAIFVVFIFIFIALVIRKVEKIPVTDKTVSLKLSFASVILAIISWLGVSGYYNTVDIDGRTLYDKLVLRNPVLVKFGSYPFYFRDIQDSFFYQNSLQPNEVQSFFAQGDIYKESSHFGVIADNNLIMILLESFEWFVIDEKLTPNLYWLSQNGLSFENYYSKNKTNNSQIISVLGSHPNHDNFLLLDNSIVKNYDKDKAFRFSLVNKLKDSGMKHTTYIEGLYGDFYNNQSILPKIGFDALFFSDRGLKIIESGNYSVRLADLARDSLIVENNIDSFIPKGQQRFFTFWTTLTTHGPYEYNHRLETLYKKIDTLYPSLKQEIPEDLYYYQAAAMDVDAGIGVLINTLKERQLFDKTTIVVYADHQAYYGELSNRVKNIELTASENIELYRVPMMIYSSQIPAEKITRFTSSYNLVPTLLDLFGIEYNTNYYSAHSIYDERYKTDVFLSRLGGIFNQQFFTIDGGITVTSLEEKNNNEADLESFRHSIKQLLEKQNYLDYLYQNGTITPTE